MPIYKDSAGCLVLDFHAGDIAVSANAPEDGKPIDELSFSAGPAGEIGRPYVPPEGATTATTGCVVRMVFRNPESLQVVLEELTRVRDAISKPPTVEVFSLPDCPFMYCDLKSPGICEKTGKCIHRT